jgi:hypothetical protein
MWVLVPIFCIFLALMVGSLFAGVFWLVGSTWPWLLIGLGAWMFWHQDGRHRRQRPPRRGWAERPTPLRDAAAPGPISRTPEARPRQKPELPIDLQVKVEQIRRKVDVLLGFADRFPPFSQDLYLVRQTASDYLPRTVNAFLSLPADAVDKPLSAGRQHTAREELRAQLELLDSKLDEIAQDLQRQDADRLLANRRFLEARFGTREGAKEAQLSA